MFIRRKILRDQPPRQRNTRYRRPTEAKRLQERSTLRNDALIVALAAKEVSDQPKRDLGLPLLICETTDLSVESGNTCVIKRLLPPNAKV